MFWIILLVILFLIYSFINRSVENHQRWGHSFDNLSFSSDEFYTSAQEAIKKRVTDDVYFSRTTYSEGGLLSANREYLHIERGEHIFDICAAPYGTCFFVSTWFCERPSVIKKLLRNIEKLAPFLDRKTYYQIDTEGMFKGAVHAGVLDAIDTMTTSKGVRGLTEFERRYPELAR